MRGYGITPKQRKYAYHVMNTSETKKDAMLKAGYSDNMSNQPSRVENSDGFKLAMAKQAFEAGNIASSLMHEMQVRGYKGYDNKELFQALDVISKAFERFTPKQDKAQDTGMRSVFANVIDVTPVTNSQSEITPLQNKDELPKDIDNTPEVLHDTQ